MFITSFVNGGFIRGEQIVTGDVMRETLHQKDPEFHDSKNGARSTTFVIKSVNFSSCFNPI